MKTEQWEAACLQESWRLGTKDFHIDNYRIFFQCNSVKTNTKGRVMGGVCIILPPTFDLAHKKSGKETITIPASEDEKFEGRFIGVPLRKKQQRGDGHHTLLNLSPSQQQRIQELQLNSKLTTKPSPSEVEYHTVTRHQCKYRDKRK
jgi:hypothetical protein